MAYYNLKSMFRNIFKSIDVDGFPRLHVKIHTELKISSTFKDEIETEYLILLF